VPTLVTIGDFSRMSYLTVKALRHYHDIGLLAPHTVDEQNGYRLYDIDQVPVAQTIRRFRELDLSTDDIRAVLAAPDVASRNALLVAHLERMEARLEETRGTVASLRSLLEQATVDPEVSYRELTPTIVVAIRESVAFDDAEAWCEQAYRDLHALLDGRAALADGPDGALYAASFFEDGEGEVIAFVPVRGDVPTSGRVVQLEVPGFDAAVARHTGPFDDLDRTYRALGTHVAEHAIGAPGPMREHYLDGDTIEVCWPITARPRGPRRVPA
jgi:DNA-binding transcriptional MerR regulator